MDAHPDVYIPSESLFIVDYLRAGDRLPHWILRPLLFHEPQLRCWYEGPPELDSSVADTLAAVHRRMAERSGARVWGQKTPRFVRSRSLIDGAFGGCRWILVYRDPRAVCASMRRSGQHTHSVSRACARWKHDNRDIVEFVSGSEPCPDNVHLVKYEELIRHFDDTLARLLHFLDLAPVPAEQLIENAEPVFFPGSGFEINTIRDGVMPDADRIDDWKSILSPREVAWIERTCEREMEILDYPRSGPGAGALPVVSDSLRKLQDTGIVWRYLRHWPSYPFYTICRKLILLAFGGRGAR